jgi:hypothetical protein
MNALAQSQESDLSNNNECLSLNSRSLGAAQVRWVGKCNNGRVHGRGVLELSKNIEKGSESDQLYFTFVGEFNDGQFIEGSVTRKSKFGNLSYEGGYSLWGYALNGKLKNTVNGPDKKFSENYIGEFANGRPNGRGEYVRTDDKNILEYTGNFKAGKFDGVGVLKEYEIINSVKHLVIEKTGGFKEDKLEGEASKKIYYRETEDYEKYHYEYTGLFVDNKINGPGIKKGFKANGVLFRSERGNFVNGELAGKVSFDFIDSKMSGEAYYSNDELDGEFKVKYDDSVFVEGQFISDKPSGVFKFTYKNNNKFIKAEDIQKEESIFDQLEIILTEYKKSIDEKDAEILAQKSVINPIGKLSTTKEAIVDDCIKKYPEKSTERTLIISSVSHQAVNYCYDLTVSDRQKYIDKDQKILANQWFDFIRKKSKTLTNSTDDGEIMQCSRTFFKKNYEGLLSIHFIGAMFPGANANFRQYNREIAALCRNFMMQLQIENTYLKR